MIGFDNKEEVDEEIECLALSGTQDNPAISLHAATGVRARGFQTMKVHVRIGDALPLGEYDMVLGVQWLSTMGPILWDFAKHTMAFKRGAKRVLWRGIDTTPGLSAATLSGSGDNLMDALLEEFAGLFAEPQGFLRVDTSLTAFASSEE